MSPDDLRGIFLFAGLNDEQLTALSAAAEEVHFESGDVLFSEGEPAAFWWVLLEGRVELVRRTEHEQAVAGVMDRPGVWSGGFLAWTDKASYLGTGRAASGGRMLRIPSQELGRLARGWFPFGVHLIEGFFSTVRNMEALTRQRESLIALGTLAAGLAHELNNPASAAVRAVEALGDTSDTLLSCLVQLAERALAAEQYVALDALRRQAGLSAAPAGPLALADREAELSDWLEDRGAAAAWRIAPQLAAGGVDLEWCERAADVLAGPTLEPGLEWVASTLTMASLLDEVKDSTGRISALVTAVKSYSQLDRASAQLVDLTEGIESTLVMLAHKLAAGVEVLRDYGSDVPRVEANPGELNQVWTNIIDNAVDAMDGRGTLRIATRSSGGRVIVEFTDNGPGMPPEVQERAFEAFYTTKDVGKGTGLGLDISRRIVTGRHHGEIAIESRPGQTVLRVVLPVRRA